MERRLFTLEEAQNLVPWLSETFERLGPTREKATRLTTEIRELMERLHANGGSDVDKQLDLKRRALKETSDLIADQLQKVHERGILVKSAEQGLVDFPSMRNGREVLLCWLEGEEQVGFWHDLDTGFAGRQPL